MRQVRKCEARKNAQNLYMNKTFEGVKQDKDDYIYIYYSTKQSSNDINIPHTIKFL